MKPLLRVLVLSLAPVSPADPDYFRPISKGFFEPDDPRGPMDIRGNGRWVFQPELAAKT
jgi:hypothetical protein